jgi:hypothetical protein
MRILVLVLGVLAALAPISAEAHRVTVDCTGAGDYLTLPEGMAHAGSADTVMVAPCVYAVGGAGWPITLTTNSPWIVGRDGAEMTILQGTGSETAFKINAGVTNARRRMRGLTFRNLAHLIYKPGEDDGGQLIFTDNVVEYCTGGLDASSTGTAAVVARNVFRYSGGIGLYHNNGVVEYNELCYGSGGMGMHCCEVPQIRYNHIHHNTGTGIYTSFSCNIQHNVIEDNGGNGIWKYSGGNVQWNVIRRNGTGVYCFLGTGGFTNNDIYDNVTHNVEASEYSSRGTIDARSNWWGTTDPTVIAQGIWDHNDDPAIGGTVLFDPWCMSLGCGPSGVEAASWGAIKAMFR